MFREFDELSIPRKYSNEVMGESMEYVHWFSSHIQIFVPLIMGVGSNKYDRLVIKCDWKLLDRGFVAGNIIDKS